MGCCGRSRTLSPPPSPPPVAAMQSHHPHPPKVKVKHQVLLTIPSCRVHLMAAGESVELAAGDFTLVQISDDGVLLATIIKVGDHLQWPLTKDEPVVKLDPMHYLFSLPVVKDGGPLSYGVSFSDAAGGEALDKLLQENSCFSAAAASRRKTDIDWQEFAPKIDAYNNVIAKAIAGGTGHIVKGIFRCSNAYTNQVQKGGTTILTKGVDEKNGISTNTTYEGNDNGINKSLKSVRNLSKMTENMSKTMLDGVGIATGSVTSPILRSQAGKAFFSMVPGEVLLASLDAVNTIMDAAEAAQKQALSSTSDVATRMVSQRFGENAGQATGDALATAGHVAGTAWNVVKFRKALNPASSVSNGVLKNAPKTRL